MKKNNFFKRRKKVSEKKETTQVINSNVDFYGMGLDDVQEYHNPYLTVTEYFENESIQAKKLIS